MLHRHIDLTLLFLLLFCTATQAQKEFPYPHIPDSIEVNHDRLTWMLNHFWQSFDVADLSAENISTGEQGFVDFVTLLAAADSLQTAEAAHIFAQRMMTEPAAATPYIDIIDHYLRDPLSPLRDDRIYAALTGAILSLPGNALTAETKARLTDARQLAMLNMSGIVANDFTFADNAGKEYRLYDIKAQYLVLYFYDPECAECRQLKDRVIQSPVLQDERIKVVRIYPEEDANAWTKAARNLPPAWTDGRVTGGALASQRIYWFAQMPSFYLLDTDKRVVLKDATLDQLEHKLQEILQ